MPKNCSADVEKVISYVDMIFTMGTQSQINSLKSLFGMEDVAHLDDAAGARELLTARFVPGNDLTLP